MDHVVTNEARNERANTYDDDAPNKRECIWIDRGKRLAADDNSCRGKAKSKDQVSTGQVATIEKRTY